TPANPRPPTAYFGEPVHSGCALIRRDHLANVTKHGDVQRMFSLRSGTPPRTRAFGLAPSRSAGPPPRPRARHHTLPRRATTAARPRRGAGGRGAAREQAGRS